MNKKIKIAVVACAASLATGCAVMEPKNPMTFFVTSAGTGKGADLGGLAGADKHCEALAASVGAAGGNRVWRAYLSTSGGGAVNARDRIGKGPWQNAKGVVVATSVEDLHGAGSRMSKENSLTEKGDVVPGRGDKPNQHDMLTGSGMDGRALSGKELTCANWTSSDAGSAMVGHHDRQGLSETAEAKSWNGSHPTKGCSQQALVSTGGAGQFYCFAAN